MLSLFFRDRVGPFWQAVRDHLYNLMVNANEPTLLVERAVVGLLRVAIRLLRREDIAVQVSCEADKGNIEHTGMIVLLKHTVFPRLEPGPRLEPCPV